MSIVAANITHPSEDTSTEIKTMRSTSVIPPAIPRRSTRGCWGAERGFHHTQGHTPPEQLQQRGGETKRHGARHDAAHRCALSRVCVCKKACRDLVPPLTQHKVFTPAFAASGERAVSQHTRASSAATRWKAGYAKKVPVANQKSNLGRRNQVFCASLQHHRTVNPTHIYKAEHCAVLAAPNAPRCGNPLPASQTVRSIRGFASIPHLQSGNGPRCPSRTRSSTLRPPMTTCATCRSSRSRARRAGPPPPETPVVRV